MEVKAQNKRPDVLIIGAGLCGLYAGIELARSGTKVTILEKSTRIGGLAAGYKFGENYCDFGVHMLHAHDKEIFEDCAQLMGKERIEAALDARIKWGNSTCRYPLRFTDMLKAMPPLTLFRCVSGLLIAELKGSKNKQNLESAEDALIAFYGSPLYEYFFEEFTHEYWNVHPKDLSAEFVRRKMPRLSAIDVVRKCLPFSNKKNADLAGSALAVETLHYSQSGSEALPRSLANEFEKLGGILHTESEIESIRNEDNRCKVSYQSNDVAEQWNGDHILNTAPLHAFTAMLGDTAPVEVTQAVSKLRYKPTVIFAILVKKSRCMDGLYTYFRNRVFHRVGEPKNAGLQVNQQGHSILIVEATCDIDDYQWQGSEQFKVEIMRDLELEKICTEEDIVEWKLMRSAHGYPIYTKGFEVHFEQFQQWIDTQPQFSSTGRQGGFCYPAMHATMRLGKEKAAEIIQACELSR